MKIRLHVRATVGVTNQGVIIQESLVACVPAMTVVGVGSLKCN